VVSKMINESRMVFSWFRTLLGWIPAAACPRVP
jgi:hypothetical protein